MRFYIKRLKEFDSLKNIIANYTQAGAMNKALEAFDKNIAKMMMNEAINASSFRMYILPKRKSKLNQKRGEVYKANFKKYLYSEKHYIDNVASYSASYQKANYIARVSEPVSARSYYTKHGYYPYSRKHPNPPIPPEFVNIQSGELVNSYAYELKLASNYRSIIFKMRNESIHFFFMVDSVNNDNYKMMDRPILHYIASRFYTVYKDELPRISSLFSPIEYRR